MESVTEREALALPRRQCVVLPSHPGEMLGDRAALGVAANGCGSALLGVE
jgi:hypothetical protein